MSLRDAVLAALLEAEASGYDLAKSFDASVANFWMATPQQLYRELDRLAEQGLIQSRVVEQERRPNKRMYSLTPAGHEAVIDEPIRDGFGRLALGDSVWRIAGPDLAAGQKVRIVGADGAVLKVEAV